MKPKKFKAETEIAEIIIPYLKEMGWEVYQEVQPRNHGSVADIVATQGQLVWVLECKNSFGLAVMSQAYDWKKYAHYVSIVVPHSYRDNNNNIKKEILNYFGIGCYQVLKQERYDMKGYVNKVTQFFPVKLNRQAMAHVIRECLTEEHKTWAKAGNANGDRFTPFQNTKKQLIATVRQYPGITIKELITSIDHHYSNEASAKVSILQWIHKGIISEIQLKREGRSYKAYLLKEDKNEIKKKR